jgi:hypothetical protein
MRPFLGPQLNSTRLARLKFYSLQALPVGLVLCSLRPFDSVYVKNRPVASEVITI